MNMNQAIESLLDSLPDRDHPAGGTYSDHLRRQWEELWARGDREKIREWLENALLLQLGEDRSEELIDLAAANGFKLRAPEVWPSLQ